MNTKALRQKILDLAIHGKLVPQDPNDEPASVLLERIKAEKERLIKEGKIKRSKRSKAACDKPHYPYELPEGWCWCKLGDICRFENGYAFSSNNYMPTGTPLIRIANISENKIDLSSCVYIQEKVDDRFTISYGDLLIAMSGATTGKMGVYLHKDKALLNQRVGNLKIINLDSLLPEYRNYFMQSKVNEILKRAYGGAQPNISSSNICDIDFLLPPLKEQHRIVEKVKYWFALIDIIESGKDDLQETIKQAKSKILDLAIHGKLVPQDPNDEPATELLKRINPKAEITCDNPQYGKLPDGWCMTNIGSLFEAVSAKRVLKSEWKNKGIPFYRAREIVQLNKEGFADKDLFVSEEHYAELKEKYGVPICDDIMISAVGSIGYTYIVRKEDVFYYKDASVLCLKNTNHWNPTFFTIWLASPFLQEQMYKNSKGTTVDTITLEKLKGYAIPFPPIKEQHRIVAKIEELFTQLDKIEVSL